VKLVLLIVKRYSMRN